jgi:hypothetical protein
MGRRGFVPADVPPIPAELRHDYEHNPDTGRCTQCPLPKWNRRMHHPSLAQRAEWARFDERLLGEPVS